ncbi:hypothetical protein B0H13DRAFT_1929597 [Mycena leptocephala]|nr:hypothetical protein B0H13DRAFT_1929597 [Mycena leptocephala]
MTMADTGLKTLVLHPDDGITVSYGGSTTLNISPKVGGKIGTIKNGDEIVLVPTDEEYKFTYGGPGDTIVKVNYPSAGASVTITGGSKYVGTTPFIVKTKLSLD